MLSIVYARVSFLLIHISPRNDIINYFIPKGLIDSSGLKMKMVSQLRQHDAAIMELGLEYTDKMAIPPGVLAFPLSGYCIAECTKTVNTILIIIHYSFIGRILCFHEI